MLITQLLPLSIPLSLSLLLLCLLVSPSPSSLPRSEQDWSSASSLWNHLPATAAGEKHQLLILHTNGKLLQQTKLYILARFPSIGCGLIVSHLSFLYFHAEMIISKVS